jgi:hypothetical protein
MLRQAIYRRHSLSRHALKLPCALRSATLHSIMMEPACPACPRLIRQWCSGLVWSRCVGWSRLLAASCQCHFARENLPGCTGAPDL